MQTNRINFKHPNLRRNNFKTLSQPNPTINRIVPLPSVDFGSCSHNAWLAIWDVVFLENSFLLVGLYYDLRYGTQLKLFTSKFFHLDK